MHITDMTIDDLKHCHRILASDIEECEVLMQDGPTDFTERMMAREDEDKRVLAKIEAILGYKPEYVASKEIDSEP